MNSKIGWGILSTGRIARTFAQSVLESKIGWLAAVGSRTERAAREFAKSFGINHAHGGYQKLLKDPAVEAVYIATPHPAHAEWAVKAARGGKHILCEKPLTMNAAEAQKVIGAARRNKVFLMEAFAYRCHPQTAKLLRLVKKGAIGKVRLIQASFCFNAAYNPQNRLFNRKLGGGGILDIGCYPVSMARLIAGGEPVEVKGIGHTGKSGVDEWAMALLKFPGDVLAEVTCGIRTQGETILRVHGTGGSITVPLPWSCGHQAGKTSLLVRKKGRTQKLEVKSGRSLYVWEADELAQCVRQGKRQSPAMGWADSLGNMKTLDLWLKSIK
jgi:predicted dehydrogenase